MKSQYIKIQNFQKLLGHSKNRPYCQIPNNFTQNPEKKKTSHIKNEKGSTSLSLKNHDQPKANVKTSKLHICKDTNKYIHTSVCTIYVYIYIYMSILA